MRQSAAGSLTARRHANVPAKAEVDDDYYRRSHGSSMLGGNMFEDERRLVMDWKCRAWTRTSST
jgi:hypothetical protein